MTAIIMKQTPAGRRAYLISREDAEAMVADGKAVQDAAHTGIYEEVTDEERSQGYMTRNMFPLPPMKKRGRQAKPRDAENDNAEEAGK